MSELPPMNPPPPGPVYYPPGQPLNYQTTMGWGNAPMLVLLHGIFMAILAGLNGLAGLFQVGFAILMPILMYTGSSPSGEPWVVVAIYLAMGLLCLGAGIVQAITAIKMLRKRPNSWGWGLAGAIVSCCQIWCGATCLVPLAAGIFGIVALSLDTTRRYMASWTPGSTHSFPLDPSAAGPR